MVEKEGEGGGRMAPSFLTDIPMLRKHSFL